MKNAPHLRLAALLPLILILLTTGCGAGPDGPATATPMDVSSPATGAPVAAPTSAAAVATPTAPTASPQTGPATPVEEVHLGLPAGDLYGILATALDKQRGLLYALGRTGDSGGANNALSVVDLGRGAVADSAELPVAFGSFVTMNLSADGGSLYVSGAGLEQDPELLLVDTGQGEAEFGDVRMRRRGVRGMALDTGTDRLFVLDEQRLRSLEATTLQEEASVELPDVATYPSGVFMALNSVAGRLYVRLMDAGTVAVYRTEDLTRLDDIPVEATILTMLPDPTAPRTYLLTERYDHAESGSPLRTQAALIEGDQLTATWPEGEGYSIRRIAFDEDLGQLFLLEGRQSGQDEPAAVQVCALDPTSGETVRSTVFPEQPNLYGLATVFAYQDHLYRLTYGGLLSPVSVSTGEPATTIYLGVSLTGATLDEASGRLYILDSTGAIRVLETPSLREVGTWRSVVGTGLTEVVRSSLTVADGRLYVSDVLADVTVVLDADSGERLATIPKGGQVTTDLAGNRLFVTDQGVYVVDATTLEITDSIDETVRETQFSGEPSAMAARYEEQLDLLFVTMTNNVPGSGNSSWLQIYDGKTLTRLASDIKTDQQFLNGLAVDPDAGRVWVASSFPGRDLAAFDITGELLIRLQSIGGQLFLDAPRDRLYTSSWQGLVTIDTETHDVLHYYPLDGYYVQFTVLDRHHQRFYTAAADSARLIAFDPRAEPVATVEELEALPEEVVEYLAVSGDGALVAANESGHVFRKDGNGWLRVGGTLPAQGVPTLMAAPDADHTFFAYNDTDVTGSGSLYGIFRSTDGGTTWRVASRGMKDFRVHSLALSPSFGTDGEGLLLAGKTDLYHTADGGDTWRLVEGTPSEPMLSVAMGPASPDAPRFLLLVEDTETGQQVFVYAPTDDAGAMERVGAIPAFPFTVKGVALSPDFASDGTALVGAGENGLLLSQDFGHTWQAVGPAGGSHYVGYQVVFSPDFASDHTVYALITPPYYFGPAEASQLLRSTDGGVTWEGAVEGDERLSAMAMGPDRTLWAADAMGAIRVLDPADLSWEAAVRSGPTATSVPSGPTSVPATATPLPTMSASPPTGLYEPEGPFADLWKGDAALRQGLGWATEPQPTEMPGAFEFFQGGSMIWLQTPARIYALFQDNTWLGFDDTWTEDQPDHDPSIVPPEGMLQPIRGFGKVWREHLEVRDRLGWAMLEEVGHAAIVQNFERGLVVYINDATYVLIGSGAEPGTWSRKR